MLPLYYLLLYSQDLDNGLTEGCHNPDSLLQTYNCIGGYIEFHSLLNLPLLESEPDMLEIRSYICRSNRKVVLFHSSAD